MLVSVVEPRNDRRISEVHQLGFGHAAAQVTEITDVDNPFSQERQSRPIGIHVRLVGYCDDPTGSDQSWYLSSACHSTSRETVDAWHAVPETHRAPGPDRVPWILRPRAVHTEPLVACHVTGHPGTGLVSP